MVILPKLEMGTIILGRREYDSILWTLNFGRFAVVDREGMFNHKRQFGVRHEVIQIVKGGKHETLTWSHRLPTLPLPSPCKIILIIEFRLDFFIIYNPISFEHMLLLLLLLNSHLTMQLKCRCLFKMGNQNRLTYLNSNSSTINRMALVTIESVEAKKYQTLQSYLDHCHSMCCRCVDHLQHTILSRCLPSHMSYVR